MSAFMPECLLSSLNSFSDAQIGWIAYSGGMDSSVLLHALVAIRDRLAFEIRAVHVDHGLHADSRAWSEHCARACERLAVPLRTRRVEVAPVRGESLEALARKARYGAMADLLGQGDLLLAAQHKDDQAETLLLALMRGSGPAGLAAMPRLASLGAGRLLRPLLDYSRMELLDYATCRNLDWLEDPGNRSLRFDRNFLRHRVLPLLAERWPSYATSIARSAEYCGEAQGVINLFVEDELSKVGGGRPNTLSIARLRNLSLPVRKSVLRHWFRKRGLAPPDSRHMGRIASEVMGTRADANPLVAWPGCEVRRYRDDLFAMEPLPALPPTGPLPWKKGILRLPCGFGQLKLLAGRGQELGPLDVFADGLEVRFGVHGLACRRVPGGHRRSLKKLFQEAGVPPWIRPYIPLIFAQGALAAVGDFWVCFPDGAAQERRLQVRWESDLRRLFESDQ
jgi:tRNA(Ile)-lysidine synthase